MRPTNLILLALLSLPGVCCAQQGHPLAGIWLGNWGPNAEERNDVVLELTWRDTTISGNINPGFPDAATITRAELDSSAWTVHIEAAGQDAAGNPVTVIVDGAIGNLGSSNRTLNGTWQHGTTRGEFSLQRE